MNTNSINSGPCGGAAKTKLGRSLVHGLNRASIAKPAAVFRLYADGAHDVQFSSRAGQITLRDRVNVVGIYGVAPVPGLRHRLQTRHGELFRFERSFGFDPAALASDSETLRQFLP